MNFFWGFKNTVLFMFYFRGSGMENKERRKKRLRLGWILKGEVGLERKQRETQEAEKTGE